MTPKGFTVLSGPHATCVNSTAAAAAASAPAAADAPAAAAADDAPISYEEFVEKAVCGQTAVKKTRAFTLEVVEDADAGLKLETRSGPIQFEKDPNDASAGAIGGGRKEGCSCIFGNPCQDPEVCLDWHNREAVAKKNGWKGF